MKQKLLLCALISSLLCVTANASTDSLAGCNAAGGCVLADNSEAKAQDMPEGRSIFDKKLLSDYQTMKAEQEKEMQKLQEEQKEEEGRIQTLQLKKEPGKLQISVENTKIEKDGVSTTSEVYLKGGTPGAAISWIITGKAQISKQDKIFDKEGNAKGILISTIEDLQNGVSVNATELEKTETSK